jgi:hypothetical protein
VKNPVIKTTTTGSGRQNVVGRIQAMAYASGGFPDTGQLFVAREAGPELVGRIGSSTAVVNNDQIVAAVSKGVYDAVTAAMPRSGGQSGDLVLRVSESDFARIALRSIENYKRQTGAVSMA